MPAFAQSVMKLFGDLSLPYSEEIVQAVTPLGYADTAEYLLDRYMLSIPKDMLVDRLMNYAFEAYATRIPAKNTVKETLEYLHHRGFCLHILTASPHFFLDVCLARLGLLRFFDHVWSCEEFGTDKSDPALYHKVLQILESKPSECTFLDDNIHCLSTSYAVGMDVIGVYDDSSAHMELQVRRISGKYIRSLCELRDIL